MFIVVFVVVIIIYIANDVPMVYAEVCKLNWINLRAVKGKCWGMHTEEAENGSFTHPQPFLYCLNDYSQLNVPRRRMRIPFFHYHFRCCACDSATCDNAFFHAICTIANVFTVFFFHFNNSFNFHGHSKPTILIDWFHYHNKISLKRLSMIQGWRKIWN